MFDLGTAALIATLATGVPLFAVARTVYFALISGRRFAMTDCVIQAHHQPSNDECEPIQLRLRYAYRVGCQTYFGRRYYFGSKNAFDREVLNRYPAGSRHPVFYDPKRPDRSTLQTGFHPRLWFWIIVAMILCPVFWLALVAGLVGEWKLSSDTGLL